MKSRIFLSIIVALLLVSTISAMDWDNIKEFDEDVGDYGKIEIYNSWIVPLVVKGDKVAEHTLLENTDNCLINCKASGITELFFDDKLFSNLDFENGDATGKVYYKYEFTTETTHYDKICAPDKNLTDTCEEVENGKDIIEQYEWKEYNGETLSAGIYEWEVRGVKDAEESIDWILTAQGKDLSEWAWWNAGWGKKVEVNVQDLDGSTRDNVTLLMNVSFLTDMQADFDDVRFLDASENVELFHWKENYTASDYASFWVMTNLTANENTTIYLYYNNTGAADGSDIANAFLLGTDWTAESSLPGAYQAVHGQAHSFSADAGLMMHLGDFSEDGITTAADSYADGDYPYNIINFGLSEPNSSGYGFVNGYSDLGPAAGGTMCSAATTDCFVTQIRAPENTFQEGGGNFGSAVIGLNYTTHSLRYNATTFNALMGGGTSGNKSKSAADGAVYLVVGGSHTTSTTSVKQTGYMKTTYAAPIINFGEGAAPIILPEVNLFTPTDGQNLTSTQVDFSCNATSADGIANLSLFIDSTLNFTVYNSTFENLSIAYTTNMTEGSYDYNCVAFDGAGNTGTNTTREFIVHLTSPSIFISEPSGQFPSLSNGDEMSLNWTISETGQDPAVHIKNCSYTYNGATTDLNLSTCISINSTNFTYAGGVTDIDMTVTDEFNFITSNSSSWAITFSENSQTFNANTVETTNETFVINLTYDSSEYSVITGVLSYNNTNYIGSKVGTGDTVQFTTSLLAPEIASQKNETFFWQIGLTNTTQTAWFNSSSNVQTIDTMSMSLCGAPNTASFINFTIKDEETLREINGTLAATFSYGSSDSTARKSFSYSYTGTNISRYAFCFDPVDKSYLLTANIQYGAGGYTNKFYDIVNAPLTNITTETTLFLLNESDSTSFIIQVRDSGYTDIPNAVVHVQRFDVGSGVWLTTEVVITNFEGKAVGHLYTEDADYRFLVYLNGVLSLTSGSTKIFCEVLPCTVTLTVPAGDVGELFPYEPLGELVTSLIYTEATNMFTYTHQDTSGKFTESRLVVQKVDTGGGDLGAPACNVSTTDSVGVLPCDISSTVFVNGTYVATGYNSRTDDPNYKTDRIIVKKLTTLRNTVGVDGVLWSIFFLITIVMLGVYRPSLAIIFSVIGVIFLGLLKIVDISWLAISAIIAIAIILLIGVKKQ